jgi:hypothetical protein
MPRFFYFVINFGMKFYLLEVSRLQFVQNFLADIEFHKMDTWSSNGNQVMSICEKNKKISTMICDIFFNFFSTMIVVNVLVTYDTYLHNMYVCINT